MYSATIVVVLGPHSIVLRAYIWGITYGSIEGPYVMLGFEPRMWLSKASAYLIHYISNLF